MFCILLTNYYKMDLINLKELLSNVSCTVTMQAQKSVPSDMQCKDKFLIQSTVVPYGTSEEEITSSMVESLKWILLNAITSLAAPHK